MSILLIIVAALGWFALAAQFYLIIENRVASIPETIIRYFGFFTIVTNIIVALCCTFLVIRSRSSIGKFFSKYSTVTAITVYITIVGIVYNLILRSLWKPQGLAKLVDELLHTIIPLLFILIWIIYPKAKIKWINIFTWLMFPFIYLIYILIRGTFSGYYPYPFIDVTQLGYSKVFLNSLGMLVVFFVISTIFVGIDRFIKKEHSFK
ncbi:MAG: Pr6Pr family membrane protein [Ginsengibacter sp.]